MIENAGVDSTTFWVQKDQQGDTILLSNGQHKYNLVYTSGNGNGQVNKFFNLITGVSAGSNLIIDLFNLNQVLFGETFNFSLNGGKVKALCIENLSTGVTETLTIGFAGANRFNSPFDDADTTYTLDPTSSFLISSKLGWDVSSSDRFLDLTDQGTDGPQFEITILGSI